MLDFESNKSVRFPTRGIEPENAIWRMFNSDAQNICLYQGQELGLLQDTAFPIPLDEYARQEQFGESILNFTKGWIERWKMR